MNSKKVPPFIPWLAAGVVLLLCSYIPSRDDYWETRLKTCAVSSFAAAFLWFLFPEFMKNHSHKLYGIWLILVGAYWAVTGLLGGSGVAGMDGMAAAVLGIGFLVIT